MSGNGAIPAGSYREPMIDAPIGWYDYPTLRAAFNAWRERRNISFEKLDGLLGVAKGESARVLSPNAAKRIGMNTLLLYCRGLGVCGELRHDPEAFEQVKTRLNGRSISQVRSGGIRIEFTRRHMQKIGKNGAKKRWDGVKARSASASKAAKIRWAASRAAGTSPKAARPALKSRRRPRNSALAAVQSRAAPRCASMPA
jgi:hypothetical protein